MSFRSVFVALVIGFGLIVGGFLINRQRPAGETSPAARRDMVRATGKCAECHTTQQYSVVHEYELSAPRREGRELPGVPPAGPGPGQAVSTTASSIAKA